MHVHKKNMPLKMCLNLDICERSSHDIINVIIAHFLLIFADRQQAEVSTEQIIYLELTLSELE